jgi:hypothetical protein
MYHTDHHSKDRYLHNNKIGVVKIRLGMVVMLELELPSIHILPQHETHIHSYIESIKTIPIHILYQNPICTHIDQFCTLIFMLNCNIIMSEFLLEIKEAAWACRNI